MTSLELVTKKTLTNLLHEYEILNNWQNFEIQLYFYYT